MASYLACGLWQGGFARVRCRKCPEEFLVAFSCKRRGVCPSCGAKRAAELAAFLQDAEAERIDAMEFVARVLVQISDPRRHLVRYYGAYSNASRGKCKKAAAPSELSSPHEASEDAAIPDGLYCASLRRRWAELIRRVYEVDPFICPRCGSEMRGWA